jgi:hypothetical protein
MRFEAEIRNVARQLTMPFPERRRFLRELASDMAHAYDEFRASGHSEEASHRQTLETFDIEGTDWSDLNRLHQSRVQRILDRMPRGLGEMVLDFSGVVPLMAFLILVTKEVPMFEFLREGGIPSIVVISLLGGIGLAVQLRCAFRWFVVRDHSENSIRVVPKGPLYLGLAAMLAGVVGTALGYRNVFHYWAAHPAVTPEVIRSGLAEPLASLVLASVLAGVVALLHAWLVSWHESV